MTWAQQWRRLGPWAAGGPAERAFWLALSFVACALFALPLVLMVCCKGDYMAVANESLANRYFACERIQHGEGGRVWLPQGQLLGVVQHGILLAVRLVGSGGGGGLRRDTNLFAALTNLANVLLMSGVFVAVAVGRAFRRSDKLLVFVVGLVPLYATTTVGFYYSLLPDYYQLDMALVTAAVAVFLWQLRAGPAARPWARAAGLGVLVGLLAANKITLAVPGLMALAPALLPEPFGLARLVGRTAAALASAAVAFFGTLLACYLLRPAALLEMLPRWARFASNPGGEVDFWTCRVWLSLWDYQFCYIVAFWLVAVLAATAVAFCRPDRRWVPAALGLLNLACGAACAYFLVKRPANTTFFEVAVLLTGLAAMAVGGVAARRVRQALTVVAVAGLVALGATTFPWSANLAWVKFSAAHGKSCWELHRAILRAAGGRKIVVLLPDNSYGFGGVQEFLLKGAALCDQPPTSQGGQRILNKFAPGMSFRCDADWTPPGVDFPKGAFVVWFDKPDLPPLAVRYPSLARAVSTVGIQAVGQITTAAGQTEVWARACVVR